MKLWARAFLELGTYAAAVSKKKSEAWYVRLGSLETVPQKFDNLLDLPVEGSTERGRRLRKTNLQRSFGEAQLRSYEHYYW
jgi:hypothetical protein